MNTLELLYEFTNQLQSITGRNDKESYINKYKDNVEVKKLLVNILDPMIVFGIQSKKLNKFLNKEVTSSQFNSLFECFEYLKDNNTGRDEDVKLIAAYINSQDEKYRDFLIKAITKSIKLGANVKIINKALGEELLTEFNVMLAHPYDKHADKIEGKTLYVTEKIDGCRVIAFKHGDKIDFRTRQGQQLLGLDDIEKELLQLDFDILDGELLIKNANQFKDRAVLQETLKISRKDGIKKGLDFWIFDTITHDDFKNGKSKIKYSKRRELLDLLPLQELNNVHVLPVLYKGKDMVQIQKILSELESEGLEGVMLNLDQPYQCKRSSGILKMKTFLSYDGLCKGIFEGEGRLEGKLGGIICDYKGFDLRIGSGFTDSERELYYRNPELIIDKIVEIQYFRESSNAKGGLSVSFPVFVTICEEGKEVSYN